MKPMEVIQPEHPSVTQATQRILNLIDLEAQRRIGHPELLTALTTQELKRFKRDDQILANRYGVLAAGSATSLLTSRAHLQCS